MEIIKFTLMTIGSLCLLILGAIWIESLWETLCESMSSRHKSQFVILSKKYREMSNLAEDLLRRESLDSETRKILICKYNQIMES